MQPNTIKKDVLAGKPVAGAMVFEFFAPGMAAILVNAGCRFVPYDMEHGPGFRNLEVAVRELPGSVPEEHGRADSGRGAMSSVK